MKRLEGVGSFVYHDTRYQRKERKWLGAKKWESGSGKNDMTVLE